MWRFHTEYDHTNRWVFFNFAFYTETVSSSKVQVQSIKLIL